jgi:hypothetical protein
LVADVHGEAECLVHRVTGSICYVDVDLPLCAISAVTTSHVGRRQGLASMLLARALGDAARDGAAVATLGAFEQGFYDRFGFGTGTYEHTLTFDPATLSVPVPDRPPVRLSSAEHHVEMHAAMLRRHRGHGAVVLDPPGAVAQEWAWMDKPVALGFRADDGRLTHFLLASMKDEHGPLEVEMISYEEPRQLLELLGLLRALGDQFTVCSIRDEPAGIQLQDLVRTPIRQRHVRRIAGGREATHEALAEQQDRILDLQACIGAVHLRTPPLRFGLRLTDPLADLADDTGWTGVGGTYTVSLGEASGVEAGPTDDLPVLDASVGAFTRLWLGVRPATGLSLTDDLRGPDDLLRALDEAFRLPPPRAGWSY